jgi:hypothetical protein
MITIGLPLSDRTMLGRKPNFQSGETPAFHAPCAIEMPALSANCHAPFRFNFNARNRQGGDDLWHGANQFGNPLSILALAKFAFGANPQTWAATKAIVRATTAANRIARLPISTINYETVSHALFKS